jgi:uncharacterized protein YdaU (DUF1376 family)
MSNQPFLPLFFGDLLASTATWEGEERALYILLLAYQWTAGPIPQNPKRIARMCQYEMKTFIRLWKTVGPKFVEHEDGLINVRLEQHREKAALITEKRKTAGMNGAASRWGKTPGKTPGKSRAQRLAEARELGTHTDAEWTALVTICDDRCVKCGTHKEKLNGNALCKDHITPIHLGGSDAISNIQPMCRNCNSAKGPECIDLRPTDWGERLAKRLANATQNARPMRGIQTKPNQTEEEASQGGRYE